MFYFSDTFKALKIDQDNLRKFVFEATARKDINEDFVYCLFDTILARLLD